MSSGSKCECQLEQCHGIKCNHPATEKVVTLYKTLYACWLCSKMLTKENTNEKAYEDVHRITEKIIRIAETTTRGKETATRIIGVNGCFFID